MAGRRGGAPRPGVVEVAGIGLTGQMHGLVALDAGDRVLRPAILWNDQRTAAECARRSRSGSGLEGLIAADRQPALTGFTAPKLLWLRRHEPEVYARIAHVLLPKDYVRLRLTGERATDVADASGTLLFDVAHRRWSGEMLEALDLSRGVGGAGARVAGGVGANRRRAPVAAGAGDQAAAALGVGVDRPGAASIVLGTSGVVFAALPALRPSPRRGSHAFCHAVPGTWHAMGVMLSAAGSLRWFRDACAPGMPYETLLAEAERWPPGVEGLTFLPYLAGERTPHADPDARGAFVGLELGTTAAPSAGPCSKGWPSGCGTPSSCSGALGVAPVAGRASGGGARGTLWLRIVASVLGLALELTAVEEGSAYGAALLGGVAGGVFAGPIEAVETCVRVRSCVEPEPAWVEAYDEGYARYRALYRLAAWRSG